MAELEIFQFPCLEDNFGVLIHEPDSGLTASIDVPHAETVASALKERGWKLSHIFTTHHHSDHTGGNTEIKERTGARILGPAHDTQPIPGLDQAVKGGDSFDFGRLEVRVLDTPGHTRGHVAFHVPEAGAAFVGDTLFSLGCGRVIEGTMTQMWASLDRLRQLPRDTAVYCGHEYTLANARFALTVDPENEALRRRARQVEALRAEGKATLPTSIAAELAANPFLRPESKDIRARLGMPDAPDAEVFRELRERKNRS
jgi:hydroxyacylglutathione hydrolase